MKTTFIRGIGLLLSAMIMAMQPFAQKTNSKTEAVQELSYNIIKNNLLCG